MEAIDRDGSRTRGNQWWMHKDGIDLYYADGCLVINEIPPGPVRPTLIWHDRKGGAQTSIAPYFKLLERWLVLEKLADV